MDGMGAMVVLAFVAMMAIPILAVNCGPKEITKDKAAACATACGGKVKRVSAESCECAP